MEQKFLIVHSTLHSTDLTSTNQLNKLLEQGWKVVSITAQRKDEGGFGILLEKNSNGSKTYTEEEVNELLKTQRGNSYVAVYNETQNGDTAMIASNAPEPWGWRK